MRIRHRTFYFAAKIVLALAGVAIGWGVGTTVFTAWLVWLGSWYDVEVIVIWAGIFSVLGWLVCCVPLVGLVRDTSSFWSPRRLPWSGALLGVATFMILIGWWLLQPWDLTKVLQGAPYIGYAAVTGATAGIVFSNTLPFLVKWLRETNRQGPGAST